MIAVLATAATAGGVCAVPAGERRRRADCRRKCDSRASSRRVEAIEPQPAAKSSWQGWPPEAPPPAVAPLTTAEAKERQTAWANTLGMKVESKNDLGMRFRFIPPGEFLMGSSDEQIARRSRAAAQVADAGSEPQLHRRYSDGRKAPAPRDVDASLPTTGTPK